jgi:hypothetical protein
MSTFRLALVLGIAALSSSAPARALDIELVRVVVDMDAGTPGLQSRLTVPAGTTIVEDVGIYLYDPLGERRLWGIGYLGGIDRGLTFGHTPTNQHIGQVAELIPSAGVTANPGNTSELLTRPLIIPAFDGPEVQYLEFGANAPATLASAPIQPLFTVDIVLDGPRPGDIFDFYLLDYVSMWTQGQHGVFSVTSSLGLDTGGDAIPDGTQTAFGVDPDPPVPVPPAAYLVDFIDGGDQPGPATITVASASGIGGSTPAPPVPLALHPARPSPFTHATVVDYDLASPAEVRLAVYDLTGRLVRVLASGEMESGRHSVAWDGRDRRGRELPAGVYAVRLSAGERASTRNVVLVR